MCQPGSSLPAVINAVFICCQCAARHRSVLPVLCLAYRCAAQNCILNVCQPGSSLLAAGYCLYSSSTVFVITVGDGVYGFTYDSIVGEFIMSHPDMKVGSSLPYCLWEQQTLLLC